VKRHDISQQEGYTISSDGGFLVYQKGGEVFFFENLVVIQEYDVLLLNLFSMRRHHLSKDDLTVIKTINSKFEKGHTLSDKEVSFVQSLTQSKQILSQEAISEFENRLSNIDYPDPSYWFKNIAIEISRKCNYDCLYCYQRKFNHDVAEMDDNKVLRVAEFLNWYSETCGVSNDVHELTITGGEPLLPKNVPLINNIVKTIKAREYTLYTNGTTLNMQWDSLPMELIHKIQFSLDGNENLQLQMAGKRITKLNKTLFQNTLKSISKAMTYQKEIVIASVINRDSVYFLPEFFSYLKKLNYLSYDKLAWRISVVVDYGSSDGLDHEHNTAIDLLHMVDFVKREAPELLGLINWSDSILPLLSSLRRKQNTRIGFLYRRCKNFDGIGGYFAGDGKIHYCSLAEKDYGIVGSFFPDFSVNNVFLNELTNNDIFHIEECKNCLYRYICAGGCPLYKMQFHDINRPFCGLLKNKEIIENIGYFV
jgi:uncharacterized protein